MNKRIKQVSVCLLAVLTLLTASAAPVDMRQRAEELKNLKWGMFVCWSFSTFSGREWTPGVTDAAFFKATDCDTDQWARTAKEAGMGYILFLAKHHDGFCLWDTRTTDRKVTKAPLGRDVLAELRKSCDKYGVKLALYFSEGDWTWPGAKDGKGGGSGQDAEKEKAQLTELLTNYGPVEYLWVDHAAGTGGLSHAEFLALCKTLQPGCFVGFNHGDQTGADIRIGEMGRPGPLDDPAAAPYMKGSAVPKSYLLAEFTYPLLPPHKGGAMWFYSLPEHDGLCHSAEKLYRDVLGAAQYGNIFSVDVGPDYAGRLRAIDVQTLRKVGEWIRSNAPMPESIRAYCVDFNWGPGGPNGFAPPGLWADADPVQHLAWYKALGVNAIQTFCVSCNGYAWYKNGVVPEQPGLKHDFLREITRLAHREKMRVLGYFCAGSNTKWGQEHPDLSYGFPSAPHIPYTDAYLKYLDAAIRDAVGQTEIDGFMVDWLRMPTARAGSDNRWLDCEKKLYGQLMGEPFPGERQMTSGQMTEYGRRAVERCWTTIRRAAKETNPNCIVWLTCCDVNDPHIMNSRALRETDWLLNEAGDLARTAAAERMMGPQTRLVTCLANWNRQDPMEIIPAALQEGIGIYGFVKPGTDSLPKPVETCLSLPIESLEGDDRNIAALARIFNGQPLPKPAPSPAKASSVRQETDLGKETRIDWPAFLARHDLLWEVLPAKFDHGAFLGNGLIGATIYTDGPDRLRFEVGRSDVTDHRRDNGRLPIGGMVLKTAGTIKSGTLRMDLWNAEVRGEVLTDKGRIRFRAMVHSEELALLAELEVEGGEREAAFVWEPEKAAVFRDEAKKCSIEPNPPPETGTDGETGFCEQRRAAGGAYVAAWEVRGTSDKRRLALTVADSFPGMDAKATALATVRRVAALAPDALERSHRSWWHAYYPASFLSVPDAQVEGFYWIQMYKLACATRRDRQVIDLLGPWYRPTGWPRIWWNLNIQLAYSPVYAANHLELGESFTRFLDAKRGNFVKNAKEIWGFDDCATVSHTTDYEGLRGDGTCAPKAYINPGDFTWALHLYWQQYRYSMDAALVTNQTRHAFYPLLKGSVNLYLHLLKPGEDGKLHLPRLHSPEYNQTGDVDNNYNLSLLRWGCTTLLELNARYGLNDPQRPEWERVLRDLVPYPQNENGFMIGATVPFAHSHRHWSHLLMVWPLHLLSTEQPENKALVEKTLNHWLTVENGKQIFGWSSAAASALYSTLGDGEKALECLRAHHNNKRFVMPNTQYIEGSPVIECSLVAAKALQDMLLQSWGGRIRIFPAVPAEWREAAFRDLRAEGAFLVSAARRDGKTRWVRVKSLAGEPCAIRPGFTGTFSLSDPSVAVRETAPGLYALGLRQGQEVILYQEAGDIPPEIRPCELSPEAANFWGLKE